MITRFHRIQPLIIVLLLMLVVKVVQGEVIFKDDFESGTLELGKLRNGAGWSEEVRVKVLDEMARSGQYAARFRFPGSSDLKEDAFSELRFELGALYKELWVRLDLYVPDNYRHRLPVGGHNNKGPIMLWSGAYQSAPQTTYFHFWRAKSGASPDASIVAAGWKKGGNTSLHYFDQKDLSRHSINEKWETIMIDPRTDNGRWMDVVVHIKVADPDAANGIVQLWKNGELIYSITNATNYSYDEKKNGFERGYLLGWANSGFDEDTVMYVDNVIFATTMQDVGFNQDTTRRPTAPQLSLD